jgi:hypothetical protein
LRDAGAHRRPAVADAGDVAARGLFRVLADGFVGDVYAGFVADTASPNGAAKTANDCCVSAVASSGSRTPRTTPSGSGRNVIAKLSVRRPAVVWWTPWPIVDVSRSSAARATETLVTYSDRSSPSTSTHQSLFAYGMAGQPSSLVVVSVVVWSSSACSIRPVSR